MPAAESRAGSYNPVITGTRHEIVKAVNTSLLRTVGELRMRVRQRFRSTLGVSDGIFCPRTGRTPDRTGWSRLSALPNYAAHL